MASGSCSGSNHSRSHSMDDDQSQSLVGNVSRNQIVRGELEPSTASPSSSSAVIAVISAVDSSSLPSCGLLDSPSGTAPSSSAVPEVELKDCGHAVETSEDRGGMNDVSAGNVGKKPVWNKASSGSSTENEPISSLIGNWPALSETTKNSTKSASSTKLLAEGFHDELSVSKPVSQGTGSISFPSQGQVGNNTALARNKRNAPANGSYLQQSVPIVHAATASLYNTFPMEHSPRSQLQNVKDHPQQRNSFRNRNGGPHQHRYGSGSHHNYGGRHDQDHGNQDWSTHRNFRGRDTHFHPQVGPIFVRHPHPPNTGLFMPSPVPHYKGPMAIPVVYVAAPPLEPSRGFPYVGPMPPPQVFVPYLDPLLRGKIVRQIDYYFSIENLVKDIFLRRNMDDRGWVLADLIAQFNKVMQLTDNVKNVPLVLEAMKSSSTVEVQDRKIRRRNDWRRWILPPSFQFSNPAGPQVNETSIDEVLAGQVQQIALEKTTKPNSPQNLVEFQAEIFQGQTSNGDLNSQLQRFAGEVAGRVGFEAGSDRTITTN